MKPMQEPEPSALLQAIHEATEPVAQFWPMKGFVHHNPIHGLEHLPFDEAVREAKHLFGAEGYLPNTEYRALFRTGRMTEANVDRALRRVGPRPDAAASVRMGSRRVRQTDVWKLHLVLGLEALEPELLAWQLGDGGALTRERADLPSALADRIPESLPRERELRALWASSLALVDRAHPDGERSAEGSKEDERRSIDVELPFHRTVSDWVEQLADVSIVDAINEQAIKWVAAFVDDGMAGWPMPGRELGFYPAWRELAQHDAAGRWLGIPRFKQKVRALPRDAEAAIHGSLESLGVPRARWRDFLARTLAQLPGWTGLIRWRELNPDDPRQKEHPIDVVHYLAVRLFYEVELTRVETVRLWKIDASVDAMAAYWHQRRDEYLAAMAPVARNSVRRDPAARDAWRLFQLLQCLGVAVDEARELSHEDADVLLAWLDCFPGDQHGPVWLEAYEDAYRESVLRKLTARQGTTPDATERPRAQAVFCIDVRSESFRRHLESQGPYETLGFAGFFGIPINHRAFDTDDAVALCPVLLTPDREVVEVPRSGQEEALKRYATGSRWRELGVQLFHDLKQNPLAAFMLIDVLGIFFGVRLIGKTMVRRPYRAMVDAVRRWFIGPVATEIPVDAADGGDSSRPARGFTLDEQASFVENGLRAMGLTSNLGRFVVLCGHGGNSDNNPYFAALHCGACGGRAGDPNARVFAAMANEPEVRRRLGERGLGVPVDTWFLGGKHDTNTDRVTLYDLEVVPSSHDEDLRALRRDLDHAGAHQALERCRRIPGAPRSTSPEKAWAHVEARSFDWANPRPEWGLAGNAGFIIGRRTLSRGVDLEGRMFLNSYDPVPDPDGAILEKIMTAPLIVGEWISMEHYFSAADPWRYGSGSKVIHNVVSGVGLMLGSQSDLQTGLPLQTVNDGPIHHHEPMRLLAIIEASPDVIGAIIQKHEILHRLFHNEWVNLVALDPVRFQLHRYNADATWEPLILEPAEHTA